MATVTGLTAARMLAIEAASIVDGDIVGDNLILTKHDGSTVDAGNARGPSGIGGISRVSSFPGSPTDGDVVARIDMDGSPVFSYSTEHGWLLVGPNVAQVGAVGNGPKWDLVGTGECWYKNQEGFVHGYGCLIANDTTTNGDLIATLPTGMWPSNRQDFFVHTYNGTGSIRSGWVRIQTDGTLKCGVGVTGDVTWVGANIDRLPLTQISFYAL